MQRIQQSFKEGRMIINSTRYMRKFKDWLSPPITGAVFAFVACLIFYAGFFEKVVPVASGGGPGTKGLQPDAGDAFILTLALGRINSDDFIKLLLLAFAAGFAERFVPDTLDRLTGGRTPKKPDSAES
jgi:hypothetical protein